MLLLVNGYENKEIADYLFVTPATVKFTAHHIYQKMGTRNRVETAVKWAREQEIDQILTRNDQNLVNFDQIRLF